MKRSSRVLSGISISAVVLLSVLSSTIVPVRAVDPGWGTGATTSSSQTATSHSSSATVSSARPNNSGSTGSTGKTTPAMPSKSTSNDNVAASDGADDSAVSSSVQSSSVSREPSSSSSSSSAVSSDSSSASSSSASSEPEQTYSADELLTYAEQVYQAGKSALIKANAKRVTDNNNKGAKELRRAYDLALKDVKSGKTTQAEREASVSTQKTTLQEALSERLGSLQREYDANVAQVQSQINALPDGHEHDAQAITLQNKLYTLDYELSAASDKAYTRHNKAVAKLDAVAAKASVESKAQQKADAKSTYQANLKSVAAVDPKKLTKQNVARLSDYYDNYLALKSQINGGSIKTKSVVDTALNN